MTREEYLQAFIAELRVEFPALTTDPVAVSVGFPKGRRGRKAIGQCWPPTQAEDHKPHVFVSPELGIDDMPHVLLHELAHATVGCKAGHKGPFVKLCKALGLIKPWTATTPSEPLRVRLNALAERLGVYPHGRLHDDSEPKSKSRLLLLECKCGYKLRVAAATYSAMEPVVHGGASCHFELKGA